MTCEDRLRDLESARLQEGCETDSNMRSIASAKAEIARVKASLDLIDQGIKSLEEWVLEFSEKVVLEQMQAGRTRNTPYYVIAGPVPSYQDECSRLEECYSQRRALISEVPAIVQYQSLKQAQDKVRELEQKLGRLRVQISQIERTNSQLKASAKRIDAALSRI